MDEKFILIPARQLGRLSTAVREEANDTQKILDSYKNAVSKSLRGSATNDIKAEQFKQAFSELQSFKDNELHAPIELPKQYSSQQLDIEKITDKEFFGIKNKPKALRLLRYIKTQPNIEINKNEEIVIDGRRIVGSNIQDITADLIRDLRGEPVVGSIDLARQLIKQGMPESYITNKQRRTTNINSPKTPTPLKTPQKKVKFRQLYRQ